MLFGVRSAGRDAAQYPQPERFELTRHAQRLVSFGGMPHFCLGVHLARAELTTSLELLLRRLPGLRLAHGPMPQSSAVLRGVRRLPVAFDALLRGALAEEGVARVGARAQPPTSAGSSTSNASPGRCTRAGSMPMRCGLDRCSAKLPGPK